ncbi:MAG: hypothetical protein JWO38_5182 [Gemmataceae bacterium]|nr:hypothetical protein [Gemmataceae bacterium]
METAFLIFLIVFLAGAAGLAVAYWRYRTTPARVWKARVFVHIRALQLRQQAIRDKVVRVGTALARLADEAFTRHLRTIPVERLEECPGIGTVTVSRLRAAGYRCLADVVIIRFENVPEIRQPQANALLAGVKTLLKDARSRFDAGACPEAQEFRRQVDSMRATDLEEADRQARELVAVESALHEAFDAYPFAREVTFLRFLLRQDVGQLLAGVMSRPLPEPRAVTLPVPPPPAAPFTPAPPAVPPVATVIAAEPTPAPFPLPPKPPSPPVPLPPADLFRAALDAPTRAPTPPATEHPGLAPMRAVIGLGFVVAKVDGRIAQSERKAIRAFLEQRFGHDPVLVRNIDPLMERIEKAVPDEAAAIAAVRLTVPAADLPSLYQCAEQVADASGDRNQKETEILARIAAGLGVAANPLPTTPRGKQTPAPPAPSSPPRQPDAGLTLPAPDHRTVLDIASGVPLDPDLIRRRYQLLTEKLDPAKAASFGPEFARMAEEKRKQVRAAAEALIAPFNEPLEKAAPPPPTDLRHNPDLDDVFGA